MPSARAICRDVTRVAVKSPPNITIPAGGREKEKPSTGRKDLVGPACRALPWRGLLLPTTCCTKPSPHRPAGPAVSELTCIPEYVVTAFNPFFLGGARSVCSRISFWFRAWPWPCSACSRRRPLHRAGLVGFRREPDQRDGCLLQRGV